MAEITVAEIAEICGGQVEGQPDRVLSGANTIEDAKSQDLSFVDNPKAAGAAGLSSAGCLLVSMSFRQAGNWSLIRVQNPRTAFVQALAALYPKKRSAASIHRTALTASSTIIGPNCSIGAYSTVGERASIGAGCNIGPGCHVGNDVTLGEQTTLYPNVTIYDGVLIGRRVTLHSGSVIGADGFGFSFAGDHYEKFPQVGNVEIADDVEIGANCCIDRAALGVTRIGNGTKLDNLVHVAHNCVIGKHVAIAAQAGFSGSVRVGDYAAIGGQAGIGEKAKVEAKAIVGGKSGVLTSQRIAAGEPVWGIPARPLRQHLKGLAHVAKLTDTHREIRELNKRVAELESEKGPRN